MTIDSLRATRAAPRQRTPEILPRAHLRRELEAHVARLGYSVVRATPTGTLEPEIARVSPVRGRIVYGETVLRSDLRRKRCHERLLFFSQRRTRRHSSILFFIGVAARDHQELEVLLTELEIRTSIRGGHVHIVPIAAPEGLEHRTARRQARR